MEAGAVISDASAGVAVATTESRERRAREWIRLLTAIPARFAGTASERTAAERVGEWARQLGAREVDIAPLTASPKAGAVLALHTGAAALALYLGGFLGAAVGIIAAWSFYSDFRRCRPLLSRLLGFSQSLNVIARFGNRQPSRRIILTAHIDTTQAGWLFSRTLADFFARFSGGAQNDGKVPQGPVLLPEVLMYLAATLAVFGWMGAHGTWFNLIWLATFLLLLFAVVTTLQWATAPATPGANDNASAVAAMLTCAERLTAELPADVELWAVGTGAEEVGCIGMHHLLDAHPEWQRESTYFVNFECVGGGNLHWVRTEGTLVKGGYPPMLIDLARRVAEGGKHGEATATDLMAGTDGHVPAERGYPTLSLITLEANGIPRNYHRLEDTVEAIDCDLVVRAADFGAAVATAALRGAAGALG
jgi:hypothetical protein